MQLNKIEQKFLSDVLGAELDIPVMANLRVNNNEFQVVVIPQITPDGYFELHYFGTPAYMPEGKQGWEDDEILGVHPVLEKAWSNRDIVNLELAERPHPFVLRQNTSGPNICARVLVVDNNYQGRLAIYENKVSLKKSTLKRAEFSLVDFPEIFHNAARWARNLVAKKNSMLLKTICNPRSPV